METILLTSEFICPNCKTYNKTVSKDSDNLILHFKNLGLIKFNFEDKVEDQLYCTKCREPLKLYYDAFSNQIVAECLTEPI